jgi:hypothetical protein
MKTSISPVNTAAAVIHRAALDLVLVQNTVMLARKKIVGTPKSRMASEANARKLVGEMIEYVELKSARPTFSVASAVKK